MKHEEKKELRHCALSRSDVRVELPVIYLEPSHDRVWRQLVYILESCELPHLFIELNLLIIIFIIILIVYMCNNNLYTIHIMIYEQCYMRDVIQVM